MNDLKAFVKSNIVLILIFNLNLNLFPLFNYLIDFSFQINFNFL